MKNNQFFDDLKKEYNNINKYISCTVLFISHKQKTPIRKLN